jgi:hypothetical protein
MNDGTSGFPFQNPVAESGSTASSEVVPIPWTGIRVS